MKQFLQRFFNYRVRALIRKEFNQIRRDRRLAVSLILPPVLQLTLIRVCPECDCFERSPRSGGR